MKELGVCSFSNSRIETFSLVTCNLGGTFGVNSNVADTLEVAFDGNSVVLASIVYGRYGGDKVLAHKFSEDQAQFDLIWNDKGSGREDDDVSLWRLSSSNIQGAGTSGWYPVSQTAQDSYSAPSDSSVTHIFVYGDQPGAAAPESYVRAWSDAGSGADMTVSVWRPEAPSGFTCYSFVANNSWGYNSEPSSDEVRCLNVATWTNSGVATVKVWDDNGSGADEDGSFWIVRKLGDSSVINMRSMVANNSHSQPLMFHDNMIKSNSLAFISQQ